MPSCSNSNAANDCDPNLVDCCTYPTQMQSGWASINQCTLMAWSALKRPLAHHRTISGTPPALWSPLQNNKQNKLRYHNLVSKGANSTILPLHYDGHVYNMSCNLQATTTLQIKAQKHQRASQEILSIESVDDDNYHPHKIQCRMQ